MATVYEIKETYQVGTGNLELSLVVGNGQYHNTMVELDSELLFWGRFSKMNIGNSSDCKNKQLFMEINATDTNANTDKVPVTIRLKDQGNDQQYEYEESVNGNGGSILFNVYINFK